jgi:hypothetical protein
VTNCILRDTTLGCPCRPGRPSRIACSSVTSTKVLAIHHALVRSTLDRFSTPTGVCHGNIHHAVRQPPGVALSRPEQVVHFFRQVLGIPVVSKEILSQRTADYQNWVEAFARNHRTPIAWAEKGVRKEDHVLPWQRRITKNNGYGVYYIFKSMEQGPTFRISMAKYPTKDPHYRILAHQRSRFTHY